MSARSVGITQFAEPDTGPPPNCHRFSAVNPRDPRSRRGPRTAELVAFRSRNLRLTSPLAVACSARWINYNLFLRSELCFVNDQSNPAMQIHARFCRRRGIVGFEVPGACRFGDVRRPLTVSVFGRSNNGALLRVINPPRRAHWFISREWECGGHQFWHITAIEK